MPLYPVDISFRLEIERSFGLEMRSLPAIQGATKSISPQIRSPHPSRPLRVVPNQLLCVVFAAR